MKQKLLAIGTSPQNTFSRLYSLMNCSTPYFLWRYVVSMLFTFRNDFSSSEVFLFKENCSKSQENLTWACQATMSSHSMGCPSDNKPIFKEFFKTHKLILKEFFKTRKFTLLQLL